jgi:hypothetical protein
MGYRSEVAYSICFVDEKAMGLFITHVFGSGDSHMIDALKECEVDFKELRINFHAWDTKWYDSYDDVQGHQALYQLPDKEDTQFFEQCDYKFMRVGEEQGDIDDEYSNHTSHRVDVHDEFYTNTSITLPFASNYTPYGDELAKLTPPIPTEGETNV